MYHGKSGYQIHSTHFATGIWRVCDGEPSFKACKARASRAAYHQHWDPRFWFRLLWLTFPLTTTLDDPTTFDLHLAITLVTTERRSTLGTAYFNAQWWYKMFSNTILVGYSPKRSSNHVTTILKHRRHGMSGPARHSKLCVWPGWSLVWKPLVEPERVPVRIGVCNKKQSYLSDLTTTK
jgi:hypothetical protein